MVNNLEIQMLNGKPSFKKKAVLYGLLVVLGAIFIWKMLPDKPVEIPKTTSLSQPHYIGYIHLYANTLVNLDMQHVNIVDALQAFAKETKRNIIVSPNVNGEVTLHLEQVPEDEAFHVLLASLSLATWKIGSVTFVAPHTELAEKEEESRKFHALQEASAPLTTQMFTIHYAKAKQLVKFLKNANHSMLSARGQMSVDERSNQLAVTDTPQKILFIKKLLRELDVPLKQVMIQASLASVDNDFERQLGITFDAQGGNQGALQNTIVNPKHFSFAVAHLADGSYLNVALAAMENAGRGELISSPSLFTMNQQTATIESGEEIPYQEVSASGGTGIAFKKAVLSLKVTPQILPGGKILLELQVNQDRPSSRIVQGVPAISTRQITTLVLVNNGQTIVLGGIFELNKEHNEQRVPFLGKIPILGLLFSERDTKKNKRELLIFVTPKIL